MKEVKFKGYTIKEDGTILNKDGSVKTPYMIGNYQGVALYFDGKYHKYYVHRLVAEHFVDGNDETVNHKDGNTTNNHASNLEWMSMSDNNKHAQENGLYGHRYQPMFDQGTRRKIATMYSTGRYTYQHLANLFGCSISPIRHAIEEFKKNKETLL